MGDPLTALGLVANIAQFIDYGRELFNTAKSIYDSASGFERETETCHALTVDLRTVCDKLIAPSPTAETEYEVSKLRSSMCERRRRTACAARKGKIQA
jgi:hypothetical protein